MPNVTAQFAAPVNTAGASPIPSTVKVVSFAALHNDDDSKAIVSGQLVASALNKKSFGYVTNTGMSGSNFATVAGFTPAQISSITSYQGLLGPVGPMANLSTSQKGALMTMSQTLTQNQAARIAASGAGNGSALATAFKSKLCRGDQRFGFE